MENENTSKYPVSISIKSPSSDHLFNYCTENSVLLLLWLHVIVIVIICYYQLHVLVNLVTIVDQVSLTARAV
jgi:hypothetical protein